MNGRKLSVTLNQEIEVRAPGNTYEGVATDIDDDGNLLVKTTNGEVKRIVAGDVSIRPRKQEECMLLVIDVGGTPILFSVYTTRQNLWGTGVFPQIGSVPPMNMAC